MTPFAQGYTQSNGHLYAPIPPEPADIPPGCRWLAGASAASKAAREAGPPRVVRAYKVRLNKGGYDRGGRYWGVGVHLYRIETNHGGEDTVRAGDRAGAIANWGREYGAGAIANWEYDCLDKGAV